MTTTATWYHLSVKSVGRSAGRSVVAAAAYRLGERLHDAELNQTHDYRRRGGVQSSFTIAPGHAPIWALEPATLWNEATSAEKRINSKLAREIELALPASVTGAAREQIVRDLAQSLVDRYGVAVSAAIHAPSTRGDQANFHTHMLFTTRRFDEEGLGKKTRELDDRKTGPQEVLWLREHAANLINAALEEAGSDERVDHRSYAGRGIEKEPTQHLGPEASEMERRGEETNIGDSNREAKKRNQQLVELVDELAALDAEITRAEEQKLDDRYGAGESEPGAPIEEVVVPLRGDEQDAFAAIQAATEAEAEARRASPSDPGLSRFLPEAPSAPPAEAFEAVERETISQAIVDEAATNSEAATDGGGRFARVRAWWDNMREYVAGWRDTVREHASHYLARWEKDEMQEREAEHPPEPLAAPLPAPSTSRTDLSP